MTTETGLEHINIIEDEETLEIESSKSNYFQEFYCKEMTSKEWTKFVNNCKRLIRSSIEYKQFIHQCKTNDLMTNCSILGDIDESMEVDIEIHHAIFTLHEIIEIVIDRLLAEEKKVNTFRVCHEVMKAHFNGIISVVPLSKTIHQLVHSGKLHIHMNQIYGDIVKFIEINKSGMTAENIEKIIKQIEISKLGLHEVSSQKMLKIDKKIEDQQLCIDDIDEILSSLSKSISTKKLGEGSDETD